MEEGDLPGILRLAFGDALIAATESAEGIFGQAAAMVDFQRRIQQLAYRFQAGGGVNDGGKRRGQRTHQVGVAEDGIAQSRFRVAIIGAGALYNVANFDIGWARHFTALTVNAVFQRIIVQSAVFTPQTFTVRPGLFRPRIAWIDAAHRTNGGADGAFNAVFETLLAHA